MNNNTNENNDYPKTGAPAHNNSRPRGIDSASPLTDKYPPYAPDPACMDCGGEGKIWVQVTRYNRDDEPECLDYEWEPCNCIFEYMTVEADKACPACNGTGEVEEAHIADSEMITTFYACVCLRYIPARAVEDDAK
jgi:hypothetical protein|tara:strand:- start:11303 stop:11710 length:408 start_codon:yes stop_codon:yes gene_type:complete